MSNARGMPGGGMLKLRFDRYITVRVFVNLTETDVFVSCFPSYKMIDLYLTCALYSVQGDVHKCFINKFK